MYCRNSGESRSANTFLLFWLCAQLATVVWCCGVLPLNAQEPPAQQIKPPAPYLVTDFLPGMTKVHGSMSSTDENQAVSVRLYVNQQLSDASASVDQKEGTFSFQLRQGLAAKDQLQVQQVVAGVESPLSQVKTVPDVVPNVSPAPQEGDKQISGTVQKGIETVEVTVKDKDGMAKETAKAKVDGEGKFQVSLTTALAAEDQVSAQVPGGSASKPVTAKKNDDIQLRVTSIAAFQGDNKVAVFFETLPESVEKASVQIDTDTESKTVALTADQRKGNKVEVTLDQPLLPPANSDLASSLTCVETEPATERVTCGDAHGTCAGGFVRAKLTASGKGLKIEPGCRTARVSEPVLRFDIPLKEGDEEVEGEAGPSVEKVLITVHQGVVSKAVTSERQGAPRLTLTRAAEAELATRSEELDSLEIEAKKRGVPGSAPDKNAADQARTHQVQIEQARQDVNRLDQIVEEGYLELLPVTQKVETDVDGGKFTAKLDRRLTAGEWVTIRQVFPDTFAGKQYSPKELQPTRVDSTLLDWGRFRAVFSTGAAISLGGESSSGVDPYVGFTADGRIAGQLLDKCILNVTSNCVPAKRDVRHPGVQFRDKRWAVHTFVDARLTQATKAEPATSSSTPAPTGAETVQVTPVSASLFQFGAYMPIGFGGTDWVYRGTQYSFFLGPLVKFGWQTLDNGVPVQIVKTVTGSGEDQITDEKVTQQRKGLLPFWGVGARFGFQKFDLMGSDFRNRQVSTDLIGYLDLAWGTHSAYRTYLDPVTVGNVTTTNSRLDKRIALEARLKIPFTPAFIGVDANMNTDGRDREPNDVRFLVGFRIDANKALGRVFGDVK